MAMTSQNVPLFLTIEGEGVTEEYLVVGWESEFGSYLPVGVKLGDGADTHAQIILSTGASISRYLL